MASGMSPATLLAKLNDLGKLHGIGRLDLVENRFVGMKSRGMYETPGGTILLVAHRGIESITLDRGAAHLKDELMPQICRADLQRLLVLARARDAAGRDRPVARNMVTGRCGSSSTRARASVVGRESPYSLYDQDLVTFEEERRL